METKASIPSSSIFPGKYLDYVDVTQYKGNHLPHWEADSVIYHVSFRLADSIPESLIRRWIYERNSILEIANYENRRLTEEEVNTFCTQLPRYKRPKKIIFADVPRNPTGKIEKPKLRKMYCGEGLIKTELNS